MTSASLSVIRACCCATLAGICLAFLFNYSPATLAADKQELHKIGVEVTTHLGNHQSFRQGDQIAFLLTLDRDAYITAIYVDAQNKLLKIIPNSADPQTYFKSDLFIPIPSQDAPYTFTVQPPYGKETLWVFASDREISITGGSKLDNGLLLLPQSIDEVRSKIRKNSSRWYDESSVSVTTSAE